MVYDARLDDLMGQVCTIAPPTAADRYGKPGHGTPVNVKCHVEFRDKVYTAPDGRLMNEEGRVYTSGIVACDTYSLLTLPNGAIVTIMYVGTLYDEDGPYSTVIHFGSA